MTTIRTEEEYIIRLELDKRKKAEEEKQNRLAQEEKKQLKELHQMRCPKCGMELSEIDYRGITIVKCFSCSGIWLDMGELEAISKLDQSVMIKVFDIFKK
jgi:hypothetical protein